MRPDSPRGASPARGRGASLQPPNRFERLTVALDPEFEHDARRAATVFLRDTARSIISTNESPDISFGASVNPYRGCEHGCAYCYARPTHEYLGFSSGLDFESRILVKIDAPQLLRRELSAGRWTPQPIAMSGVTDCYQPIERKLELTRRCLEVLAEFRNPVGIITKNHLVTRDIDALGELARHGACSVHLSITTLDPRLAAKLEPRASLPAHRLAAIRMLAAEGIPVGVLVAPVIPGLNEHEIPAILDAAAGAGAVRASYTILRLPFAVKDVFAAWLDAHYPDRKDRILNRVRELRDGALNGTAFGERMRGCGPQAEQIADLFRVSVRRFGLREAMPDLSTRAFRRPGGSQLDLGFADG